MYQLSSLVLLPLQCSPHELDRTFSATISQIGTVNLLLLRKVIIYCQLMQTNDISCQFMPHHEHVLASYFNILPTSTKSISISYGAALTNISSFWWCQPPQHLPTWFNWSERLHRTKCPLLTAFFYFFFLLSAWVTFLPEGVVLWFWNLTWAPK